MVSSTIPGEGDPEQAVISDSPAPTKTANARRLVNMLAFPPAADFGLIPYP
jgi:hypothetical protein